MNSDDEYQMWLDARRAESPPTELTERIMVSVREQAQEAVTSPPQVSAHKTVWQRSTPYLVLSAAAVMLAVRALSFVSPLVFPSSIADLTMTEELKEESHGP